MNLKQIKKYFDNPSITRIKDSGLFIITEWIGIHNLEYNCNNPNLTKTSYQFFVKGELWNKTLETNKIDIWNFVDSETYDKHSKIILWGYCLTLSTKLLKRILSFFNKNEEINLSFYKKDVRFGYLIFRNKYNELVFTIVSWEIEDVNSID